MRDPRGTEGQHGPARRRWGRGGCHGPRAQLRALEEEVHPADEEAAAAAQGEEAARVAGGEGEHRPPGAALPRGTAGPGARGCAGRAVYGKAAPSTCGVCVDRTGRRDGISRSVVGRAVGRARR